MSPLMKKQKKHTHTNKKQSFIVKKKAPKMERTINYISFALVFCIGVSSIEDKSFS